MGSVLRAIFDPAFMPHGHCYLWSPAMVWIQAASNVAIAAAYFAISATLAYLARRATDLPFRWVYAAFGVFIVACGFTHLSDAITIWSPLYWVDATIRVITAVASVATAALLFPLVPRALALADASRVAHERGVKLEAVNRELEALYERTRRQSELEVGRLHGELEARERRLRTIFEHVGVGIGEVAPDGRYLRINQRYCEILGYPEGELLGLRYQDVTHPDDLADDVARAEALLAGRSEGYTAEKRYVRKDGVVVWANITVSLLRNPDGSPVSFIVAADDITARRREQAVREELLARLQEAVRVREVFLAVAAHELRTPVTPLRIQVDGLLRALRLGQAERLSPERIAPKLEMASRQIARLTQLIDRLLDVSRLASGRLELEYETVDVANILREIVDRHRPELENVGGVLAVDAPASLEGRFDRARMEQVIENLLSNAIKFAGGKPVEVELTAGDESFALVVRDQGPGIPKDDQGRIFERFERVASARHYPGLGLGLWLVKEIVTAMGGHVSVASEPGRGAAFRVDLPRQPHSNSSHG